MTTMPGQPQGQGIAMKGSVHRLVQRSPGHYGRGERHIWRYNHHRLSIDQQVQQLMRLLEKTAPSSGG